MNRLEATKALVYINHHYKFKHKPNIDTTVLFTEYDINVYYYHINNVPYVFGYHRGAGCMYILLGIKSLYFSKFGRVSFDVFINMCKLIINDFYE